MATLFWVGGTGTYDGVTNRFATTSGGVATVALPTSSDSVTFDTLSNATGYTATISATLNCSDLTIGAPLTGALTFAGASAINIFGNFFIAGTNVTRTYNGAITFSATTTGKTLTFNGVTMASATVFNGVGGGWTLQDNWNNGTSAVTITNGALDTNGKTCTWQGFNSNNSNTRSITLGASTINDSGQMNVGGAGLTFTPGTSTWNFSLSGSNVISASGITFNIVNFTGGIAGVSGAVTFGTLTMNGAANKTSIFQISSANITVTGTLTLNGNSPTNRLLVQTEALGNQRTITAGTVSVTNADFVDIVGAGAGSWNLSAITGGSGDCGGNSGITFTTPANQYAKTGASANWSGAIWFTTSGGATPGRVPLPQDTAIFDANSITAGSVVITQDMPRIGGVDFTGVTNTPEWTTSTSASVYGSITLVSGMILTASTQAYTFAGRGAYTIDCGGKTWEKTITVNARTGTYTLASNYNMGVTRTLSLTSGTFDVSGSNYVISVGLVSMTGGIVNLGTATHLLTGTGTVFNGASGTINPSTSTLKITDTSNTAITFAGGGKTYNNVWFSRGTSTGNLTISGSNIFIDFKDDGSVAHSILFTAGTTQRFTTFTVSGSAGQEITINSTTTATHSLIKNGGGTITCNYLNIQHSVATPGLTWLALNSTNNQGVATVGSGWYFGSFPASYPGGGFFAFASS